MVASLLAPSVQREGSFTDNARQGLKDVSYWPDWVTWGRPLSQLLWQKGMECSDWVGLVTCLSQLLWEKDAYQKQGDGR